MVTFQQEGQDKLAAIKDKMDGAICRQICEEKHFFNPQEILV